MQELLVMVMYLLHCWIAIFTLLFLLRFLIISIIVPFICVCITDIYCLLGQSVFCNLSN